MTVRLLLGIVEAGMYPGCRLSQSTLTGASINIYRLLPDERVWYRPLEAQKRFSFFFNATTFAGAIGGLLASAIGKMDSIRNIRA